jgi:HSP20 family protein
MRRAFVPTVFDALLDDEACSLFNQVNQAMNPQGCKNCSGVNLYENEESFVLEADIPGVKSDDVKIFFDRGGISIEAKRIEEKKEVKHHLRSSSIYAYWVPLPAGRIDESAAPEAICKDGILKVVFPKSRAARPLKIAVKSA